MTAFMPVKPEFIKLGMDRLVKGREGAQRDSLAAGFCVDVSGAVRDQRGGCHGYLSSMNGTDPVVGILLREQGIVDREAADAFLTYIATENPMRQFLLNRDDLSSVTQFGFLIDSVAAGHNRLLWLAKITRYTYEAAYSYYCSHWYKLVQRGVHPLVALIAASNLTIDRQILQSVTHPQVFWNPADIEDLAQALRVTSFDPVPLWKENSSSTLNLFYRVYDSGYKPIAKYAKAPSGYGYLKPGMITCKTREVKEPDGWGGFTYKTVGNSWDELAAQLKEFTAKAEEHNRGLAVATSEVVQKVKKGINKVVKASSGAVRKRKVA